MLGRSVGLTVEQMAGMDRPDDVASFDDTDRLVLRYAETSIRGQAIDDELFAKLAAHFGKEELVELAMTVGLAALVNRMHATFRTDVDADTLAAVEGLSCPIGR